MDKVVDSFILQHRIMREGDRRHFNRRLDPSVLEHLDPDGVHVVKDLMVHEHIAGKPARPHVRCIILLKLKDQVEPETVIVDVVMETFKRMRTVEEHLRDLEAAEGEQRAL